MSDKYFSSFNGYKVKDATARKITDNFVTPEMFGAKGDGVTDDTHAINQALNAGVAVMLSGSYAVSATMQGNAPAIYGLDAKVVLLNDFGFVFRFENAKYISGVSFLCNEKGVKSCVYTSGVDSVEICNIRIDGVKDMRTESGSSLIAVSGVPTVNIHDIHAENCVHIGNGTIADDAGNISCIYVNGHTKQCTITNVTGKEIHNVNSSGDYIFEDSNVIYVHSQDANAETCIRNVYGYNYGKRLIKTQCGGSVIVDGVTSYTNSIENLASIGILPGTGATKGKATISNCSLVNECTERTNTPYLITASIPTLITNCVLKSAENFCIYCEASTTITGCNISGRGVQVGDCSVSIFNTKFSCSDAVHQYPATTGSITINGCEFASGHNIDIRKAKLFVMGCKFDGTVALQISKYGYIADSYFCGYHQTIKVPDGVSGGELICKNLTMVAKKYAQTEYAIDVRGDTKLVVENLNAVDYMYDVVAYSGVNAYLKGVNMAKVHANGASSFDNEPAYVASLPNANVTGNGAKVILLSDNKLYQMTNDSWIAVGNQ